MATVLGDLGNAVLIVVVFSLLQFFLSIGSGIANIKKNWDDYKCNPSIMPFAAVFGKNTQENFNECIKQNQVSFMGGFLEPIYGALQMFATTGQEFAQNFEDIKVLGNSSKDGGSSFIDEAGTRIKLFANEGGNMFNTVRNTFNQLTSGITVVSEILRSPEQLVQQSENSIIKTGADAL